MCMHAMCGMHMLAGCAPSHVCTACAQLEATSRELAQSAETVMLVGFAAQTARHEWMGPYARRAAALVNGRHVYVHEEDETKVLWFDAKSGSWCVAMHEAAALQQMRFFPNRAVLRAADPALAPERITGTWSSRPDLRGDTWGAAAGVRAIPAHVGEGALELRSQLRVLGTASEPVVFLVGRTPESFSRGWMGPYARLPRESSTSTKHSVYKHRAGGGRELRYHPHTGEWRVGKLDPATGVFEHSMAVYDGALIPERVGGLWRVQTDVGWADAPDVACLTGADGMHTEPHTVHSSQCIPCAVHH